MEQRSPAAGPPHTASPGETPGLAPSPLGLAPTCSPQSSREADHRTDRLITRPEDRAYSSNGKDPLCRGRCQRTGKGETAALSASPSTNPAAIFLHLRELTDHVAAGDGAGRKKTSLRRCERRPAQAPSSGTHRRGVSPVERLWDLHSWSSREPTASLPGSPDPWPARAVHPVSAEGPSSLPLAQLLPRDEFLFLRYHLSSPQFCIASWEDFKQSWPVHLRYP
ncbi:uncharacterized protein LOC123384634 isoform X3 [Felis catus]|uniref:uncharacterized protein LOC123384634 isoform X3 n=1 Tax=Felis catus TaxID=9685 RepID=UPI001D1A298C|nr:uncharacterized protein LOC123384634 isoform X3 [Felis catus]XP_044910935.1 uncharacterized protein LOC123384634 isoform X3 [Felis catus]XP_044910936.1 uncharacterized protein LOC123384634 isoform X3 [Felis catus]XP_044910937.1 uncharacterized protein LOC123384634 isoform X3 [Felis catus]XP_044910938.1 uncharacterized protein LOC123384634 isoform X3 [Felis catus]